jgi:hypothetical protein
MRVLLGLCLWFLAAARCPGDSPFVDPYSVASTSGEWKFSVDPSKEDGAGAARCRMTRRGAEVWSRELDLTPRECVVSDEGVVVGYAYDNGYIGRDGNVIGLVLGPDGVVLGRDVRRRDGGSFSGPPQPIAPRGLGVILDEPGHRAIVRVSRKQRAQDAAEEWWIYRLPDGKRTEVQVLPPRQRGEYAFSRGVRAELLRGTPLIGIHWFVWEAGVESAAFDLIDRSGDSVWTRRVDAEYEGMPRSWSWERLFSDGVRQLEIGKAGEFAIVSYADECRTRYTATQNAVGGWEVREAGREPAEPGTNAPGSLELLDRELIPVGEVTLGSAQRPVITGIWTLSFDDRGRAGWIRSGRGAVEESRFTLVDRDGTTIADLPLDLGPHRRSGVQFCEWLEGDRWLIAYNFAGSGGKTNSAAWWLDVPTGALTPIPGLDQGIEDVRRLPDGGFVLFDTSRGDDARLVTRFDREGKVVPHAADINAGPDNDRVWDIATLTDGTIALLSGHADRIKLFRPGEPAPIVWDVRQIFAGSRTAWYTGSGRIRADADGGLILCDASDVHRIDKDGKLRESFRARGPSDEPFRLYDAVAVDPDGRVWGSDGWRLYRFGRDGRADIALGGSPDGSLGPIATLAMDARGWYYVVERGTAFVHVFDDTGRPLRVMRPPPAEVPTQDEFARIHVLPDGGVEYRMSWAGPTVRFDAGGRYLETQTRDPRLLPDEEWSPVPGNGWEQTETSVRRTGDAASAPILRRSDNGWISNIVDAAAAPDATLAVLSEHGRDYFRLFDRTDPLWLSLFAPDGAGISTLCMPRPLASASVGFAGKHVVVHGPRQVLVFEDPAVPRARRYALPGQPDSSWTVLPRPDGTIVGWDQGTNVVHRWRLGD